MHNELFNQIDIHTYHPEALIRDRNSDGDEVKWNYLARDLWPQVFLEHIWSGRFYDDKKIKKGGKAVGFKSFADHWVDADNDDVFGDMLDDFRVKKIILKREDELAVFVSMMRAETTGIYMGNPYPLGLKVKVDVAKFQAFINNYRRTFEIKYRGPFHKRDTFHVTYEQLQDEEGFADQVAPLLWDFLGVSRAPVKRLEGVVCQSQARESFETVISNYRQVEFAFRHTGLSHFATKSPLGRPSLHGYVKPPTMTFESKLAETNDSSTWSVLLPICSRLVAENIPLDSKNANEGMLHRNRFGRWDCLAEHTTSSQDSTSVCWQRISAFAESFKSTVSGSRRARTEIVVGIDVDDSVFNVEESKERLRNMFQPSRVAFVPILKPMYGKVCRIWNKLGSASRNDFIVLLGDDIVLLDEGWQDEVEKRFHEVSIETSLPVGVAVVALSDGTYIFLQCSAYLYFRL